MMAEFPDIVNDLPGNCQIKVKIFDLKIFNGILTFAPQNKIWDIFK